MQLYNEHFAKILADDRSRFLAYEAEATARARRRAQARPKGRARVTISKLWASLRGAGDSVTSAGVTASRAGAAGRKAGAKREPGSVRKAGAVARRIMARTSIKLRQAARAGGH